MPLTDNPEREYSKVALVEEYEGCVLPAETISLDGDPLDWRLSERPLIYVAGYFSANPMHGTRNAIGYAERLLAVGWLPHVPHTSLLWDTVSGHTPEFWYELDLGMLRRCDFMYVCPDLLTAQSTGVAREIAYAREHEIPVLYHIIPAKGRYDG